MIRKTNLKQNTILILGAFVTLNLGLYIATSIKFGEGIKDPLLLTDYNQYFVAFNIVWFLLVWIIGRYQIVRSDTIPSRVWIVVGLLIVHGLIISSLWVVAKAYYYSREFLLLTYVFSAILVIWRVAFAYILRIYRKYGLNYRNFIVYGYGDIATELVHF